MIEKIEKMTLQEIVVLKRKISISSAPRDTKNKLYEACETREKELSDRHSVMIEKGEFHPDEAFRYER